MMETQVLALRMLAPAFLGNSEQAGQWRTPPFKALLRQWWRVAYAADRQFRVDVAAMRQQEGRLFGNAWLENAADERKSDGWKGNGRKSNGHCKSQVRIRLDRWDMGKETRERWGQKDQNDKLTHPEVPKPIGPLLYLGFGPLGVAQEARGRGGYVTVLKHNAALQSGESAVLSLAFPKTEALLLKQALALMDRYGTVGGRSRNGWGSFLLNSETGTSETVTSETVNSRTLNSNTGSELARPPFSAIRDWREALELDWPHALGHDERGPLVWQTSPHADWQAVMRDLAKLKIALRTQFVFTTGPKAPYPEARHWLSHPVTNHNVGSWRQARLPNSLRFKVRPAPHDPSLLVGTVFHMPCQPPAGFDPKRDLLEQTWRSVHGLLDELTQSASARGYSTIDDRPRLAKLKPLLDSLSLQRIPE